MLLNSTAALAIFLLLIGNLLGAWQNIAMQYAQMFFLTTINLAARLPFLHIHIMAIFVIAFGLIVLATFGCAHIGKKVFR